MGSQKNLSTLPWNVYISDISPDISGMAGLLDLHWLRGLVSSFIFLDLVWRTKRTAALTRGRPVTLGWDRLFDQIFLRGRSNGGYGYAAVIDLYHASPHGSHGQLSRVLDWSLAVLDSLFSHSFFAHYHHHVGTEQPLGPVHALAFGRPRVSLNLSRHVFPHHTCHGPAVPPCA